MIEPKAKSKMLSYKTRIKRKNSLFLIKYYLGVSGHNKCTTILSSDTVVQDYSDSLDRHIKFENEGINNKQELLFTINHLSATVKELKVITALRFAINPPEDNNDALPNMEQLLDIMKIVRKNLWCSKNPDVIGKIED